MNGYSTYWRTTILVAIVFHVVLAVGFAYVLPLMPEPTIEDTAELEWVDVDLLPSDVIVIDDDSIPTDTAQEALPIFNASDLVLPELTIPEPVIKEPSMPEVKPIEPPKPQSQVTNNKPTAQVKPDNEPPKEVIVVQDRSKQLMGKPPVTVKEVYPDKGSGLGYKGTVSILATIGKDGKVKATSVVLSSGRLFVDEIALKAAAKWTFKPALDQIGRPMECDKVITIDFKKFAKP